MKNILVLILALIIGTLLKSSLFIVYEGRQAVITQFGRPIGRTITDSGLHFKLPYIQEVRYLEKRILNWDGLPNQMPTLDKKYISVDTTARWRIVDPLKFIESLQNIELAQGRLSSIFDASTRDTISNNNLVEAVRNTNDIIEKIEDQRKKYKNLKVLEGVGDVEVLKDVPKIGIGREKLSEMIAKKADEELSQYGIKVIDVQIRRISYDVRVEDKVYERMISERQRVAAKIRSIGAGEMAKINGRMSRDLLRIRSEAFKKAQIIKGDAEAKALQIYRKAIGTDVSFFEFMRSMEIYQKMLSNKTKFILSSDSKLLKNINY